LKTTVDKLSPEEGKTFYYDAIDEVMQGIGSKRLDQTTTDEILKNLDAFTTRLNDAPYEWYWSTLKEKARVLVSKARQHTAKLGDPAVVELLLKTLENPPATDQDLEFNHAYWMVRLLYSRREFPLDIKGLVGTYTPSSPNIPDVFKLADNQAWTRVKKDNVTVELCSATSEKQALIPMQFEVKFNEASGLADSYFVQKVLKYDWEFKLNRVVIGKKEKIIGPHVTFYTTSPGQLEVKVTIHHPGHVPVKTGEDCVEQNLQVDNNSTSLTIDKNTELGCTKSFAASEGLLMLIVAAVTLATSLPTLYYSNPTFGSSADYAAILAWAVGVDQGKNLIQMLSAFPADGSTTGTNP
jgi:hypothetical protein